MAKYVISGYLGFDNFGDEAIAKVLTTHLKNINAEKITVLSSNPNKTAKFYNVESVNFLKFINPILKSDVLISGGGSLLQDITSLKSLIYYLAVIVTALVFNKKVIIFAQGFTPFRTKIGKFLTKFVLKYCDKIYVRDFQSQSMLSSMNLNSELIADPVFSIEIPSVENKNGIGVQLRDYSTLKNSFLKSLADEIAKNFPNETIKIFSLQNSLDYEISIKFAELLKNKNIKTEIYDHTEIDETISEISRLEYLIAMRFHACLVGAKAGVKTLGINYDVKVKNLANIIGFPVANLDKTNLSEEFKELFSIDVKNYNIPEFKFPEL